MTDKVSVVERLARSSLKVGDRPSGRIEQMRTSRVRASSPTIGFGAPQKAPGQGSHGDRTTPTLRSCRQGCLFQAIAS